MAAAVDDVQDRLQSAGLVDASTGWTSVKRRLHDVQHQLVMIAEDGGTRNEVARATGMGDMALKAPAVLVTVRGEPWDGDASRAKAQAILDELHGINDETVGSTTYLKVRSRTPEPVFAGFDDNGRPRHTLSFVLTTDA